MYSDTIALRNEQQTEEILPAVTHWDNSQASQPPIPTHFTSRRECSSHIL